VAYELTATHTVLLSMGKSWQVVPQRLLGKDSMWWFDQIGALRADKDTAFGRWVRAHDVIPGWHLRRAALRRLGVRLVPRTVDATAEELQFADGTAARCEAVLWTIGYRDKTAWLHIPAAVDAHGNCLEHRGLSPVPGLFYVGRSWQTNRASALLCGVGAEAAAMVNRIVQYVHKTP
jgi:putative flavoprotein involved in K+ transport